MGSTICRVLAVTAALFAAAAVTPGLVAQAAADITLTPASHDYGPVPVGSVADQDFTLHNDGDSPISFGSVSVGPGPYGLQAGFCFSVPAHGDCTWTVRFQPSSIGSYPATLTFAAFSNSLPNQTATLNGQGIASAPPVLSLPAPITAEATGPAGAAVTYTATATDDVDGALPVTCDHPSGSTFPLGATTVTCSATDSEGQTTTGTFTITVVDTTPPAFSGVPASITVDATGPTGAVVTYAAPTATDLVDGAVPVTCAPTSGSLFPIGTTVVTCTASDAHGNVAHVSFSVTVRGAAAQLAALYDYVKSLPPGASLAAKVHAAQAALAAGRAPSACGSLLALINEAKAQSSKKLTAAQAQAIIAAAQQIRALLGCV